MLGTELFFVSLDFGKLSLGPFDTNAVIETQMFSKTIKEL
jgi:hypothetical protein